VLAIFTAAMLVAWIAPQVGFALICGALLLHLRPKAPPPGGEARESHKSTTMPRPEVCAVSTAK